MSRRKFIRKLGMGVASIPLVSKVSANHRPTKNHKPLLKLGVLVPDAPKYSLMSDNFLDGLRLAINRPNDEHSHEIELHIERYQTSGSDLKLKTNKLAEYHKVDIMTGLVSGHNTHILKPILEAREILFLENNLGERMQSVEPESTCIYRNSLHLWNSSFVSGTWAAKHLGSTCLIATSFYDSGFANIAAFHKGFEMAGGKILKTCTTHLREDDGFGELFSHINHLKPDFVLGCYSNHEAINFVHSYKHQGIDVPLLGAGLLCNVSNLSVQNSSAEGIMSIGTWTRELNNVMNKTFVSEFENTHQRHVDVFSVLGYESGQLFRKSLSSLHKHPTTEELIRAFKNLKVESPRGTLCMTNQHTTVPTYVKKVSKRKGYYAEHAIDKLALQNHKHPSINELSLSIQSGWTNAYMA